MTVWRIPKPHLRKVGGAWACGKPWVVEPPCVGMTWRQAWQAWQAWQVSRGHFLP